MAHTSALPFKDNLLGSQVPTWASTLASTSDQFCSSWRLGLNHTPWMRVGSSHQRKGPGRVSLPLQAPSCKPLFLSKLTLAPAICLYSASTFFTALYIQTVWYEDCDIICGNSCCKRASKRDTAQGWICPLIPKTTEQRLQSEDIEKERQGAAMLDQSLDREGLPFTCTTAWGLWYIMLIHLQNSGWNLAVSKTDAKN